MELLSVLDGKGSQRSGGYDGKRESDVNAYFPDGAKGCVKWDV